MSKRPLVAEIMISFSILDAMTCSARSTLLTQHGKHIAFGGLGQGLGSNAPQMICVAS